MKWGENDKSFKRNSDPSSQIPNEEQKLSMELQQAIIRGNRFNEDYYIAEKFKTNIGYRTVKMEDGTIQVETFIKRAKKT